MSENTDLVKRLLAAWARGEDPADLGLIADDVEYVSPPTAVEPGIREGREGWSTAMRSIREAFGEASIEAHSFEELGDRVLVIGTLHARARSGVEGAVEQGYVFTVRDGRMSRFEWYPDPEVARQAATGSG